MKILFTLYSILLLFAFSIHTNAQWQRTNGPHGGYMNCAVNTVNEIYVGTQYGGVFRSTNQGANWTPRNHGLRSYEINCLTMDGDELYVGTNLGGDQGVYHSNDDGNNWTPLSNLWTSYVSSCIEASGDDIYVGTAGGGNFFSHDGGQTWGSSTSGILPYSYYISSQLMILNDKLLTIVNGRLYGSIDGGSTYSTMDNGFPASTYVMKISKVGDLLFAASMAGLYTSSDEGLSWTILTANLPSMPYGMSMSTAGNSIYIAGGLDGEILFSNNNGVDWSTLNTDWGAGVTTYFALSDGELLVQTGNYSIDYSIFDSPKLHYTNNNGSTWTDVTDEITSTWCLSLAAQGNDVYAGTQFTGMYKTSNEGDNWELVQTPDSWTSFGTMGTYGNTIIAAGDGGMLRSIDNGTTWTVCNQGIPSLGTLGFAQVGTDIFATTPMGIVVSTDDGQTWSTSDNGIEGQYIVDIISIGNTLYAVAQSGVYTSANFGNSWVNTDNNLPSDFSPQKIAHLGAVLFTAGLNSMGEFVIYRSNDNGGSWNLLNSPAYLFPTSFAAYDDKLFVGSTSSLPMPGVFMTNDLGETWSDVSEGIDNNLISDLLVNNGWLYASTKGSGVYKRPLSEFLPADITHVQVENISIYPNPTYDKLTLNIPSGLVGSAVTITNELGQQVMLLGKTITTRFQIDSASLAPGIYMVQVGNQSTSLRFIKD